MDTPKTATTKLSVKQEKFCHLYLELGNASQAYRQAFDCQRMTPQTIRNEASLLSNTAKVKARISELQNELNAKARFSKEKILAELETIIDADITNYLDFDGTDINYKDLNGLPKTQTKAIESIKQGKNGIEIKLHSKPWAIDRLCKLLGYDAPIKNELTGKGGSELLAPLQLNKLTKEELNTYHAILEKAGESSY